MNDALPELIANRVTIKDGMVELELIDGSRHAFPVHYYPRLSAASPAQLREVYLRVGGRALRWEDIDEDIWIADAVLQKYPLPVNPSPAGPQGQSKNILKIPYSPNLPELLKMAPDECESYLRMALAAKLFDLGKFSSGQAAEIAGVSRCEFIMQLSRFHVEAIQWCPDAFDKELETS